MTGSTRASEAICSPSSGTPGPGDSRATTAAADRLDQGVDDQPAGPFDRHRNLPCRSHARQFTKHSLESLRAVNDMQLENFFPFRINDTKSVSLFSPVQTSSPHGTTPPLELAFSVPGGRGGRSLKGALGVRVPWRDTLWSLRTSRSLRGSRSHGGCLAASESGSPRSGTGCPNHRPTGDGRGNSSLGRVVQ